jgi:ESCRT-II complex subunit VPS22
MLYLPAPPMNHTYTANKGFWAQVLGVGDFYYEIAIQAIDVCLATRPTNGGIISLRELVAIIKQIRGKHAQRISTNDVLTAIRKVAGLGNGFQVLDFPSGAMVVSVPMELSTGHRKVLELAQSSGMVTVSQLQTELKWNEANCERILNMLMHEGMAWIDKQANEPQYWFPSILMSKSASAAVDEDDDED